MVVDEERWRILTTQAAGQYGLLTRREILSQLSKGEFEARVRQGVFQRAGRSVWLIAGSQHTWRQRVKAASLSLRPVGVASHATAARLWELRTAPEEQEIHLSVLPRRSGRSWPGVRVHRTNLYPHEVLTRHGIETTSPARTLSDLAGAMTCAELGRCLDEAMRGGLIGTKDLESMRIAAYHRSGAPALEVALAQRSGELGESVWEDVVFGWLVTAGLPPPVRQYPVTLTGMTVRLDLAYPDQRVGVEFDGWAWHRVRSRFDRDRWRASELALAGWTIIWVTSAQTQTEVVGRVRRALQQVR